MNTNQLTLMLQIAGVLHIGLIAAGALMPRAVNLRANLAPLPTFIRRLFWVYYTFIGLCLVSFGALTILLPRPWRPVAASRGPSVCFWRCSGPSGWSPRPLSSMSGPT